MAIFQKDLEKINKLNELYTKKNIKAELLQLTNSMKDSNYNSYDLNYELDISHDAYYEKSLEYLKKINNNHIGFFLNTINSSADKNIEILKNNERLLYEIKNEINVLNNAKLQSNEDNSNSFYSDFLYLPNSLDETTDFFNGHFLFNKKLTNLLNKGINLNADQIVSEQFKYLNSILGSIESENIISKTNDLNNINKLDMIIDNTISDSSSSFLISSFNTRLKLNQFFKNYLSHMIDLNQNNLITNFKKYPVSISGLSQSIYNLIENENYLSNNSLFYGIFPFSKIKGLNTSLLLDVPIFQKSLNIEYFPLKYIDKKNILLLDNNNLLRQFFDAIDNQVINTPSFKILSNEEKNRINTLRKFIIRNNNLLNSSKFNLLNVEQTKTNELESYCNVSIQHKFENTLYSLEEENNNNNKFEIFKNSYFNNKEDNNAPPQEILIKDSDDDENYTLYKEFKKDKKVNGLNLIQLIASKVKSEHVKVVSVYDTTFNNGTGFSYNLAATPSNDSTKNITDNSVNSISIPGVNQIRSRGATPLNQRTQLITENPTTKNQSTSNLTQNTVFQPIQNQSTGKTTQSQSTVLISETLKNANIKTQKGKIVYSYKVKKLLNDNMKGILNYDHFDDNQYFASSIVKNRYLINDINKTAKNLLIFSGFSIRNNLLDNNRSNLSNTKIINKNYDKIEYSLNINDIKNNFFAKFYSNNENVKNIFSNNFYIEESLGFLNTEGNDVILNEKYILKNKSFVNESSIKYNIENFKNINKDIIDIEKSISANEFKDLYNNNITDFNSFDKFYEKEKLNHFSNTYETFEFIKKICKEYISNNLTNDDHKSNFAKRANIVETASLLYALTGKSTIYADKNNENYYNNYENIKLNYKNELLNILLYEYYLNVKNKTESLKNRKIDLLKSIMTPTLISEISGFYVYSPTLDENNYHNFNPYHNVNEDNSQNFNLIDQDGLFYHFLFNLISQSKHYQYNQDGDIIESDNNFDINRFINSNLCIYTDDITDNVYFKNIFNSGRYDDFKHDMAQEQYSQTQIQTYNALLPFIEYNITDDNPSFIVSMKLDWNKDLSKLKDVISQSLNVRNEVGNNTNHKFYIKNLQKIIDNIDNIILEKNILNKANINKSFINHDDSFLSTFFKQLIDFPEMKSIFQNIEINSYDSFKSINSLQINKVKSLLESSLFVCADVFLRMFSEIQSYNSLCDRTFDANFFANNYVIQSNIDPNSYNHNISNFYKTIDYMKNMNNTRFPTRNELLGTYNINSFRFNSGYFGEDNNDLNESSKNIVNSESVFSSYKNLKPSEFKFMHYLNKILGIQITDIIKIFTYIKTNPNLFTKNSNIFEYFNTTSFKLKNIINFKNIGNEKFSMTNDVSTYLYDLLFEYSKLNQINEIFDFNQNHPERLFLEYVKDNLNKDVQIIGQVENHEMSINIICDGFGSNIPAPPLNFSLDPWNTTQIDNSKNFISTVYNQIKNDNGLTDAITNTQKQKKIDEFIAIINSGKYKQGSISLGKTILSLITEVIIPHNIDSLNFNNIVSLKDIFEYIVVPSYTLNKNYYNFEKDENLISGCENVIEDNNYLNYKNSESVIKNKRYNTNDLLFKNILDHYYNRNINSANPFSLTYKNSIDVSHNWYNHISRGLLLNDISSAMNMELVKYYNMYENGIGADSYEMYNTLIQHRNLAIDTTQQGQPLYVTSVNDSLNYLKNNTNLKSFKLNENNFVLKNSYLKTFMQSKKLNYLKQNISQFPTYNNSSNRFESKSIENLIGEITNTSNRNLILSDFYDFYLKKMKDNGKNKEFVNEYLFNKNFNSINSSENTINLHAQNLNNCDILTIGIENNDIVFENNDIVSITIDLIDHDYPEIIWDSKKYYFDMSIEDSLAEVVELNSILNDFKTDSLQSDALTSLEQLSGYSEFINIPFIDYDMNNLSFSNDDNKLKSLISYNESDSNAIKNSIDRTNNINSKLLKQNFIIGAGINSNIENLINKRKSILSNKFSNVKIINDISNNDFNDYINDIVYSCIFNQKLNLKLKKYLKLTTGFEPNINFSLKSNKRLQEILVLNEVYDLFIDDIFSNIDFTKENSLGFKKSDLESAFSLDELNAEDLYSINGYNFKVGHLSSNENINVLIRFMSDLTKMIIPDFSIMEDPNFRKIVNVSIDPKDFVLKQIYHNSRTNNYISNFDYPYLKLDRLNSNIIYNEIRTKYDYLNKKILEKAGYDTIYYRVLENDTNKQYVPKNYSYRIKVDLLD